MNGEWGRWLRESFDKLLLFITFLFTCWLVLHMVHDIRDQDNILWARETAGTVLGALLGLITGHALAARSSAQATTTQGTTVTTTSEGK